MRTDPRADEVRALVKAVFAGFLQESGVGATRRLSGGMIGNRHPRQEKAAAPSPAFPRLHAPRPRCAKQACNREPQNLELDETIVIDQGRYVARSYRVAGCLAMWLVAVGIVQFYDRRGEMLATVNLFETLHPERMVA